MRHEQAIGPLLTLRGGLEAAHWSCASTQRQYDVADLAGLCTAVCVNAFLLNLASDGATPVRTYFALVIASQLLQLLWLKLGRSTYHRWRYTLTLLQRIRESCRL
jgi:hypothetical protein